MESAIRCIRTPYIIKPEFLSSVTSFKSMFFFRKERRVQICKINRALFY